MPHFSALPLSPQTPPHCLWKSLLLFLEQPLLPLPEDWHPDNPRRGVVPAAEAASAVIAAVEATVYISAHFADVPSLVREEHVYLKQI